MVSCLSHSLPSLLTHPFPHAHRYTPLTANASRLQAENSFTVVSTNAVAFPMVDFYSALAGAVGFGGINALLIYGSVIAEAAGPGTLFTPHCEAMSVFVVASVYAFLWSLLHPLLMLIAFDGFRRRIPIVFMAAGVLHLLAAFCPAVYLHSANGCVPASLSMVVVVAMMMCGG